MGKGKSNETKTSTNIPQWAQDAGESTYKSFADKSSGISDPFSESDIALGDPLTADLNADHEAAFGSARDAATSYKPYMSDPGTFSNIRASTGQSEEIDPATGQRTVAFNEFTPENIERYMDPYRETVIRDTLGESNRQADIERTRSGDAAVSAGAFGGARHGVYDAENRRNTTDLQNQLVNRMQSQAYGAGTEQYNTERDALFRQEEFNAANALRKGQMGELEQTLGLRGAQGLMAAGDKQQSTEQERRDRAAAERQRPLDNLSQQASVVGGLPYSRETIGQEAAPDRLGQGIGLASSLGGAFLMSDKDMKTNRSSAGGGEDALLAFRDLPIDNFEYKDGAQDTFGAPDGARVGPMAQDYSSEFGGDDKTIDIGNAIGELMLAIKALEARTAPMAMAA